MYGKVGHRFITCLKLTTLKFRITTNFFFFFLHFVKITTNWRSSQMADSAELHVRKGSHCKRLF